MRLTAYLLQKFAADFIQQRCKQDHTIIAACLCGSLVEGDPLWAGAPDVDVLFIHISAPAQAREVVPLVGEAHFDIHHEEQREYEASRQVRTDALRGPLIFHARPLYDPQHFFDFVQAGVRAQFDRPEYAWQRAAPLLESARNRWFALMGVDFSARFLQQYTQALEEAARGLAALAGDSLTLRRFAPQLQTALQKLEAEALFQGFLGLSGAAHLQDEAWEGLLPAWEAAWQTCSGASWEAVRLGYVRSGVQAFHQAAQATLGWWPLFSTWVDAAQQSPQAAKSLTEACASLGLDNADERRTALDAFLDTVEEFAETWKRQNGIA